MVAVAVVEVVEDPVDGIVLPVDRLEVVVESGYAN